MTLPRARTGWIDLDPDLRFAVGVLGFARHSPFASGRHGPDILDGRRFPSATGDRRDRVHERDPAGTTGGRARRRVACSPSNR